MNRQQTAASCGKKKFLAVPVRDFEAAGQEQVKYLLVAGMRPRSRVVDLGCGVLCGGYCLISFSPRGQL